jgi:hypothetical protein
MASLLPSIPVTRDGGIADMPDWIHDFLTKVWPALCEEHSVDTVPASTQHRTDENRHPPRTHEYAMRHATADDSGRRDLKERAGDVGPSLPPASIVTSGDSTPIPVRGALPEQVVLPPLNEWFASRDRNLAVRHRA